MGTIVAAAFLALFLFGYYRSPGVAITLAGILVFAFGLVPLAFMTDLHPYFLLAVTQAFNTAPSIPLGIGLMGLGRLVALAERRENLRP